MKRILNISAAIAAVLSFAACQQTQEVSENIVNVKVVTDGIIEPEDAVKTYMGENSSTGNPEVKWNEGDAIALYEFVDDATEPTQNPTSNGTRLTDDNHIAEFNVPLSADKAEGSTYTYVAIYPDGAVSKGSSGDFYRVQIPAVQTAQFIGDDYSTANFDPAADVLVGVPVVRNSRPTESDYLGFSFKRVGTIGKLTLKNLWADEVVSSVEISLPDKSKLYGYSKIDIKGGEITEAGYSTGEKITVNVPHSAEAAMETAEGINNVIYFRCLSGTWATGTDVTVKVTTDKAVYTKTTALPKDYEFVEGGLTAFSFNMSTATREEISTEDYSGSWMIVSENTDKSGVTTLYAMPAYESGNNIKAVTYTLNGEGKATSADGLDDCQYTITKVTDGGSYDGCYTIQDANGKYLYAADSDNSKNYLKGTASIATDEDADKYYWTITFVNDEYSIVAKSANRNNMRFNYNGGTPMFSCYEVDKQTAVSLFSWDDVIPAGAPVIQVSSTTLALNADGTEKADPITVTGKNLAEEITVTSSESWLTASIEDGALTVTAEENTGSEDRSATITLSSTGASNVVIEVTQDKASSGPSGNVLTFDLSTNPGGWPTANSTTLTNYTYRLGSTDYTFALNNVKCNSGYLMLTKTAVLGLPAIEGKKLTKIVATNSSGCSTSTKVGVSADSSTDPISYISGGDAQTWSVKSSAYTYELEDTEDNTVYYLIATAANAQIVTLELTYEATVALSSVTVSGTPDKTAYKEGDEFETAGLIATAKYADNSEKVVTDDVEWTVTPSSLTAGTTSVSVKASYKDIESAAYVVNGLTVTEPATLSSISVNTAPNKTTYTVGEKFDPTGLKITRTYSDETNDVYAYSGHESEFTFDPTTSTALEISNTNVTITYGGKSVAQPITVNEKVIPTFSSLEDLAAADLTSGTEVKVSFENVPIKSVYVTSKDYRNGIYFNIQKGGKDIEIYYQDVPETWVAGGTVSGTMTCPWKNFNGTWELAPEQGTWDWDNLSYTAPIAPCETPVISISESGSATISCATTGASIYYTVGTSPADPTNASTLYTGAVDMTDGQTIKAIAYKDGMNPSEVASNKYTAGGGTDPKEYTYTFNSKSWGDATSSWTSGKDGNGYTTNQGVQITSGATGANATSKSSFTNVSKIVVNYCTNSSKGKGAISVKVGSGTAKSYSVTAPSSGGTTLRNTDDFVFSTPESGTVNITVECGTNSIYINSITITAE